MKKKDVNMTENDAHDVSDSEGELSKIDFAGTNINPVLNRCLSNKVEIFKLVFQFHRSDDEE